MSFICGICKTKQKPYTTPIKQIMEIRTIYYQPMVWNLKGYCVPKFDQPMSIGHEIVHEEDLCESCVRKLMMGGFAPKVVETVTKPYLYTKKKPAPFVKKSDYESDE